MADDTKIDDGGPAFPCLDTDENRQPYRYYDGMTLRDYFAAKALEGLIAHLVGVRDGTTNDYARRAYEYADAMLKARQA